MGFLSKLFNTDSDEFREVRVDREVLESVIYYAKKAYPNEFLAFFDGKIKDKILYITSLIFLPGETCDVGAVVHTEMLPPTLKYWGSVHSHPGPSAQPSGADLKTFSAIGTYGMSVITAITAQNTEGVFDVEELSSEIIKSQIKLHRFRCRP